MFHPEVQQALADLKTGSASAVFALSRAVSVAIADDILSREPTPGSYREDFRLDRADTVGRLHPLTVSWGRHYLGATAASLADTAGGAECLAEAVVEEAHLERVAHLALERVLIHPAAPPLLVSPLPDPRISGILANKRVVAVIFDHPLAIGHELYPLWTDAYVSSQGGGAPHEIVGVHVSWLDQTCRAQRLIVFDPEADAFLEAPAAEPVACQAALLLCQSRQMHTRLSHRLTEAGLEHVNPYAGAAEIADDKWQCYCRWEQHGVPTPPTCLLDGELSPAAARAAIDGFVRDHAAPHGWIAQPRHGTEAQGVSWVAPDPGSAERLVEAWQTRAGDDGSVVRPRVGNAWLGPEEDGEPLPFDLRVHVAWDGAHHVAESGYAVVAAGSDNPISAVSHGGHVLRLDGLRQRGIWNLDASEKTPWGEADLEAAAAVAVQAVQALGPLALTGVDVKFDTGDSGGRLVPLVLDANPRPAGLIHSDLLFSSPPDPGVTSALWRHLDT